jgi:hypothetical protein
LLLLIPTEGGLSYRLFAVEDEPAAAAFVQQTYPTLRDKSFAFRPMHVPPSARSGEKAEVLVLIADPDRAGVVYVSSFEEMESAESFIRFEEKNGLSMDLVKTYWGIPQPVRGSGQSPVDAQSVAAVDIAPGHTKEQPVAAPAIPVAPQRATAGARRAATPPAAAATAEAQGVFEAIRTWAGWSTLRGRTFAVSLLNSEVHEIIGKDPIALSQGRVIVAAAAAAGALGMFWWGPFAVVTYAVLGLLGWLACAWVTYLIGTELFEARKSPETKLALFKSLAFAQAPRMLIVFGLVLPGFGPLIAFAVYVWALAASVPATEQTLEIDTQSAFLSALTGWLVLFALGQALPIILL